MSAAPRTPRSAPSQAAIDSFRVPGWMHAISGHIERHRGAWIRAGNWETKLVRERIAEVQVRKPIYIAGLARSGTTVLLELLAGHPQAASHRYRDYPPVFTPYAWNRFVDRAQAKSEAPSERAHGDGIAVNADSPEAFEEALWMAFFPRLHEAGHSSVLDRQTSRPEFERFYDEHLRKLMAVRGSSRYVAKGNYNLTRLAYLQKLYPDARFVLAIREPLGHIASLLKQQTLFAAGGHAHPRAVDHLRRVGHFEFGLDRRAIATGDVRAAEAIQQHWAGGDEVSGWARYWANVYGWLQAQLAEDQALCEASLIVRFEDLCREPHKTIAKLFAHVELEPDSKRLAAAADGMRFPGYYQAGFSDEERAVIQQETAATAALFGYQ